MPTVYEGISCKKLMNFIINDDSEIDYLIISICSDDLLPVDLKDVFKLIEQSHCLKFNIYILGDLVGLPLDKWRVRDYLIKEISFLAKNKILTIYWYDGDKIREGNIFFCKTPLHIDRLSYQPKMCLVDLNIDTSSNVRHISFLDSRAYPKNILKNKTKKEIDYIFSQVAEIEKLESIECPFLNNLTISRLPKNLKKLDLRGCENIKIDAECLPPGLDSINLSACRLDYFPDFITTLVKLRFLFLYKNFIDINSANMIPKNVEVLSLYRNKIKEFEVNSMALRRLNLGANPLVKFTLGELPTCLNLGLRKVNLDKLTISQYSNLSIEF
ncbi:hypothetical protein [Thiothrix subterranea]|uniref:Uncharacterized protein n=1 Tax=Thiothrix subterranea TaxID=2735563 RepID=A0AA51MQX8_9GAMM|nr:hypothetical protein [Thiothrix subterranea]WML88735.1 hypothetical protein RCG00_10215 [Thiothrix subterranea]